MAVFLVTHLNFNGIEKPLLEIVVNLKYAKVMFSYTNCVNSIL